MMAALAASLGGSFPWRVWREMKSNVEPSVVFSQRIPFQSRLHKYAHFTFSL